MATDVPHSDPFAQIGAQRAAERDASLVEPRPPRLPRRVWRLDGTDPAAGFASRPRLETEAQVRDALERLRAHHAPFLRDLAPPLEVTRQRVALATFDWRLETEADRQDGSRVMDGRGDWSSVTLPHYGGPLGRATAFYRTPFEAPRALLARGALFVHFSGVDYRAVAQVNGRCVGAHEGFFAPFEFEVTPYVREGGNVLLVRVENDAICMGNASWGADGAAFEGDKLYAATGPGYDEPVDGWHHCPPGMGLYQDVWLEARPRLFVSDFFVRPLDDLQSAEVWVEVWNCDATRRAARLELAVFGLNFEGVVVPWREMPLPGPLGPGVNYLRFRLDLPAARRWEPDAPWLHQIQARVRAADGALLDHAARPFGLRTFRMTGPAAGGGRRRVPPTAGGPAGRFLLNGREIRLRGANTMGFEQQDVMRRDARQLVDDLLLAKLGHLNFLRLTQRPVQAEVYDLCDRLGLMTQTDLPLFGYLRRNQFCEAVRQAEEMERLVRAHPCNVLVSYINEPFPAEWGAQAHRHATRPELEAFFRAADEAVHLAHPDRVIKAVDGDYDPPAPGFPDTHCYTAWYNGHGLELGRLHRGYWQRVRPGWCYGCGEFGAEGLDPADLMRRRYPSAWLPSPSEDERTWTPDRIPKAQTGHFHGMFFDTPATVEGWVEASQRHQAWATRLMTEAFRRDARMTSFAIHLFIDAWPSGWMKAIVDVERRPKPAFFAYREALTPLMANLRSDRRAFFAGEWADVEAWVCNDRATAPEGGRLLCRLEMDGEPLAAGARPAHVPLCSSAFQARVRVRMPPVKERRTVILRLALADATGAILHDTDIELTVFPRPPRASFGVVLLDAGEATPAAQLARELGARIRRGLPQPGETALVSDPEIVAARAEDIRVAVEAGAWLVVLDPPENELQICGEHIQVRPCGMGGRQFVSRATGHPLVEGFRPDDFRWWHSPADDCVRPLLERVFRADDWAPILTTADTQWEGATSRALAVGERRIGRGGVRLCLLQLVGRTRTNPVADAFARRLIGRHPQGA